MVDLMEIEDLIADEIGVSVWDPEGQRAAARRVMTALLEAGILVRTGGTVAAQIVMDMAATNSLSTAEVVKVLGLDNLVQERNSAREELAILQHQLRVLTELEKHRAWMAPRMTQLQAELDEAHQDVRDWHDRYAAVHERLREMLTEMRSWKAPPHYADVVKWADQLQIIIHGLNDEES